MWTSLRIYIYKIVDFISGLSGLLYRTGWTSVNGILNFISVKFNMINDHNKQLKKSAEFITLQNFYYVNNWIDIQDN